jgi:hypothetical protein
MPVPRSTTLTLTSDPALSVRTTRVRSSLGLAGHRVARVDDQVEHDLLQLDAIALDGRHHPRRGSPRPPPRDS